MSINPIPPTTSPTTAGQLAAEATANDQALAARIAALEAGGGGGGGGVTVHGDLTGRFEPNQHPIGAISGLTATLANKSDADHQHLVSDVSGLQSLLDSKASQSDLDEGLAGKAAWDHNHNIGDVSNLRETLAGKAEAVHTHDDRYYTETEVDTALAGKANTSHSHGVSDLTTTGTPSATTYLRGDGAWATPAGGGAADFRTRLVGRWHGSLVSGGATDGEVMGNGILWCLPTWLEGSRLDAAWHRLQITEAGTTLRLGLYAVDDTTGLPGALFWDSGPLDGGVAGNRIVNIDIEPPSGPYYAVAVVNSATAKSYVFKGAVMDRNWVGATNPDNEPHKGVTIPGYDSTVALPATAVTTGWSTVPQPAAITFRRGA